MEKTKSKFLLASMKLLANFENTFSSPVQRPYIGDLILRIQPPVILNIVPESGYDILHSRKSTRIKDENRPMAEKKNWIEILMWISKQCLELVGRCLKK